MGYIITDNLFSAAEAGQRIGQAKQVEQSSAMNLLQSLKGVTNTAYTVVADEFHKEMKFQEEEAIQKGVTQGTIAVSPEQYEVDTRDGHTAYDKAYNKAQHAQVASNVSVLARTRTAELAETYAQDPDGFKGATVGLFESITEDYGFQPDIQAVLFQELTSEMGRYLPSIAVKGYQKQKDIKAAAETKSYNALTNVGLNTVRSGNLEMYTQDRDKVTAQLNDMLSEGQINQHQYNESINSFDKEAASQMVIGRVERKLEGSDLDAAILERDSWVKDVRESDLLSPDEIDREVNRLNGMIASKARDMQSVVKEQKFDIQLDTVKFDRGQLIDYNDKSAVKAVNARYGKETLALQAQLASGEINQVEFEEAQLRFVEDYGILPKALQSSLITQLANNDLNIAARAAEKIEQLIDTNTSNSSYIQRQFKAQDIKEVQEIMALRQTLDPDTAITKYRENQNLDADARYKFNTAGESDNDLREESINIVDDFLDDKMSWLVDDAEMSSINKPYIYQDAETLYKANLHKYSSPEAARAATNKELNRKWQNTTANGDETTVTRYPLETTYGGWAVDQWKEQRNLIAKKFGVTEGIHLEVDPMSAIRSNKPVYFLFQKDEDGILSPLLNKEGKRAMWQPNKDRYDSKVDALDSEVQSKRDALQTEELRIREIQDLISSAPTHYKN